MPWVRLLSLCATFIACILCPRVNAQVVDHFGSDVQWMLLAPSVRATQRVHLKGAATSDAVYSNLRPFRNHSCTRRRQPQ